jgi:NAD-dependent DNA ligase
MENLTPKNCPKCNEPLEWEGVHLICHGEKCISKIITSIHYFYTDKGIMIDGIGPMVIEKLLQNDKIYKVLSVKPWALLDPLAYNITIEAYNILGRKTYDHIMDGIKQTYGTKTMVNFIAGLGLPGLGYKNALRLCQYIKTGKLNYHVPLKARESFLEAVVAFNDASGEMKNFSFAPIPSPAKAIYCITGTLSMSRNEMVEFLSKYDYEFTPHMNKETNYLIVGEDPGNIKIKFAEKYNIPQITEEQFMKLLDKEMK